MAPASQFHMSTFRSKDWSRWLPAAPAARCDTDRLEVPHDHVSQSLAVRRSGITVALHMLESRGVIKSHRKRVEILDQAGLLREAEGFYGPNDEVASMLPQS